MSGIVANVPAGEAPRGGTVIVGGGLAGLFCALKLAPRPVTIVTAAPLGKGSSSAWAQGGIAAAISPGDTVEAHLADTIAAGAGIVDQDAARLMVGEAADRVADLLAYGVPFDRDMEGRLQFSREAAHSQNRIVRVGGDGAGRAIMEALIAAVRQTPSIELIEGYAAEELILKEGAASGVFVRDMAGGGLRMRLDAAAVIIATGGAGHLYEITTNPVEACGEGIGMAARAGAVMADCEFVQFHPTAIDVGIDPAPLATEALRGHGATLVNARGERFMTACDPAGELAPRDIVARAIFQEISAGRGAYLDCTEAVGRNFAREFPVVYARCRQAGIDPAVEKIPVKPAAHYFMGGVAADIDGRTSIPGLWACGECASTGVHGANRLASNSLLEAVFFAARTASSVNAGEQHDCTSAVTRTICENAVCDQPIDANAMALLRDAMSSKFGVVRCHDDMLDGIETLDRLSASHSDNPRFANMLATAKLIAASALAREESRGAHFRSDYPFERKEFSKRSFLTIHQAISIAETARSLVA